jgi:hypothetical protein
MVEGRESNGDSKEVGAVAQEDDAWECFPK